LQKRLASFVFTLRLPQALVACGKHAEDDMRAGTSVIAVRYNCAGLNGPVVPNPAMPS